MRLFNQALTPNKMEGTSRYIEEKNSFFKGIWQDIFQKNPQSTS